MDPSLPSSKAGALSIVLSSQGSRTFDVERPPWACGINFLRVGLTFLNYTAAVLDAHGVKPNLGWTEMEFSLNGDVQMFKIRPERRFGCEYCPGRKVSAVSCISVLSLVVSPIGSDPAAGVPRPWLSRCCQIVMTATCTSDNSWRLCVLLVESFWFLTLGGHEADDRDDTDSVTERSEITEWRFQPQERGVILEVKIFNWMDPPSSPAPALLQTIALCK